MRLLTGSNCVGLHVVLYYLLHCITYSLVDDHFRDQRLTQDVDKFCQELKKVVPQVVIAPFVIVYYTYKTYAR